MGRHDVVIASLSGDSDISPFVAQLLEFGGVTQPQPDVEPDTAQHARQQERNAPPVRVHRAIGENRLQHGDGDRAEQETADHRPDQERDHEPAVLVRRILSEEARSAAVFAARRKALQAAEKQQQQRGGHADRVVARHQADGERRSRHQQNHDRQHALPADSIGERSEEEAADRAHEERRREDREGVEQRDGVVAGREELVGDVGGQHAVDREVEPLDGVADRGPSHRLSHVRRVRLSLRDLLVMDGHGASPRSRIGSVVDR